jgi:hypothetical protein
MIGASKLALKAGFYLQAAATGLGPAKAGNEFYLFYKKTIATSGFLGTMSLLIEDVSPDHPRLLQIAYGKFGLYNYITVKVGGRK